MALAEGTSLSLSSASSSSSDVSAALDKERLSYDKNALWSLRQTPASTARPIFLSKEFDSPDGLWDPEKWHKAQSNNVGQGPRSGSVNASVPKGISSKSKGDEDVNIVLGPQRRSFGLGCHVTPTTKDLGDRGKPNGFSVADSKDQRYIDGERLEKPRNDLRKSIGSGRLQQIPGSDHRAGDAVKTRADLEPSWRRDRGSPSLNRGAGDNAKHFGNVRAPVLKGAKDEPEWFTADITQEDTIELHGFDVPEPLATNAARAPNKKLKPSTDSSKPIKEKSSKDKNRGISTATQDESKSVEILPEGGQNMPDRMHSVPQEQSTAAFDFNKFIEDLSSFKPIQDAAADPDMEAKLASLVESKPTREGSRFSRWFGNTSGNAGEQVTCDAGVLPSATVSTAVTSDPSPIASSVSNLFKQWDAQEKSGLPPAPTSSSPSHNTVVASSSSTSELTSNLKSLLLHCDSQQLDRKQSELPAELVKLYGHLEARPLPSDGVHTLNEIESAPVVEAHWPAGIRKQTLEKSDMPAFQKLVSMLQSAGELSKDMPKMPMELAMKHQPDSQASNVFPRKQAVLAFEAKSNSPCIPSSSPVPESHRHSLVDAWLRSSDNQEASLAQALEHSPADSPLMFSTQPPGHVAVPAPIHAMQQPHHVQDGRRNGSALDVLATLASQTAVAQSGSAFVKPVRPTEGGQGQSYNIDVLFPTGFRHHEEERTVVTPLSSELGSRHSIASQPVVPAGFTPTSVMRKQASTKVSKREKTRPVPLQGAAATPSVDSPQRESPAVSYGVDQWQALLSAQRHQAISGGAIDSGIVDVGEQTMAVTGLPGLASQAPAITVPALDVPRDPSVTANIPLMNMAAYSQQASYGSIHQPSLMRTPAAPMLRPQMPLVGMSPAMPAVLAVNAQPPLRRPILKSGSDVSAPVGLPLVPGHGLLPQSQQLLLEQNRLLPAHHDNNVLHMLNQQHLLQLRLQQQPPPAALIHAAIPQSLFAPMVSQGVPRQMPVPPSPELSSVSTMPGVYRNPAMSRHQPMAVPGVPGLPVHLSIRTDSTAVANEGDPLRKWFNHGFLQQMSAVPPPKLGCALNVDDLEAS